MAADSADPWTGAKLRSSLAVYDLVKRYAVTSVNLFALVTPGNPLIFEKVEFIPILEKSSIHFWLQLWGTFPSATNPLLAGLVIQKRLTNI